jgi:AcrR family transcriptional regulator
MSQIAAEASGIGRATLYKYFPDVESILRAWHERQVGAHLHQLHAARKRPSRVPGMTSTSGSFGAATGPRGGTHLSGCRPVSAY